MRKLIFVTINGLVLAGFALHLYDSYNVNRFASVGGPEEFRRQKYEQLERLRSNLDHLPAKLREQEERRIDDQLDEIDFDLPVVELGRELRRIK